MMRALYTAATGMIAQQYNIDTISNNLANVNTTGFRKNAAHFQDLIYQNLRAPGTPVGPSVVPVGQDVGLGVKIGASEKTFTQGVLQQTSNPLDIAIEGDGFFQVLQPDGTPAYTRDGSFKRDANGSIVTADGNFLSPQITIPANATSVQIGQDGIVTALIPGQQQPQQLGQIQLVRFTNAAGLAPKGQNLFVQTGASGAPTLSQPGLNGTGTLQGGYLEQSNVAVVEEMVNLITAQRAYEANSKAIVTADEMLQTAVQTKR
ncbi:MAG TPA: flagellar basal-body rod protein FlgG [Candidatus Elarobacter sp.]|jgi:flagellar basal-body rod protein FlgG|nr:flagellar basal-body rod protein FlgG [Candidatus Elarobacter sp.]